MGERGQLNRKSYGLLASLGAALGVWGWFQVRSSGPLPETRSEHFKSPVQSELSPDTTVHAGGSEQQLATLFSHAPIAGRLIAEQKKKIHSVRAQKSQTDDGLQSKVGGYSVCESKWDEVLSLSLEELAERFAMGQIDTSRACADMEKAHGFIEMQDGRCNPFPM